MTTIVQTAKKLAVNGYEYLRDPIGGLRTMPSPRRKPYTTTKLQFSSTATTIAMTPIVSRRQGRGRRRNGWNWRVALV